MSKKNSIQKTYTERTSIPKIQGGKHGQYVLMCPFCNPSHPVLPFTQHPCGTEVEIIARQKVYRAKSVNAKCAKCGGNDGQMVKWNNGYVHTPDCTPSILLLNEETKFSKFAEVVYNMKDGRIKQAIQNVRGRAASVEITDPDGKRTGEIRYFFHRSTNAQHPKTSPREPIPPTGAG